MTKTYPHYHNVIVCGGRNYGYNEDGSVNTNAVERLHLVLRGIDPMVLISGGARGADFWAHQWGRDHRGSHSVEDPFRMRVFYADWSKHGNSAGPIRNAKMLEYLKEQDYSKAVIAFPGGKGTAHMVKIARDAGIDVIEIKED